MSPLLHQYLLIWQGRCLSKYSLKPGSATLDASDTAKYVTLIYACYPWIISTIKKCYHITLGNMQAYYPYASVYAIIKLYAFTHTPPNTTHTPPITTYTSPIHHSYHHSYTTNCLSDTAVVSIETPWLFSSPELKAQASYLDRPLSVVRLSIRLSVCL
jgi:hypothetical protein